MSKPGSDRSTRHMGAGLTMAVVVGAFAFAGRWLDEKTGMGPTFLLIGFVLGGVGGFIHLVSVIDPTLLPFHSRRSSDTGSPEPEPDAVPDAETPDAGTPDAETPDAESGDTELN